MNSASNRKCSAVGILKKRVWTGILHQSRSLQTTPRYYVGYQFTAAVAVASLAEHPDGCITVHGLLITGMLPICSYRGKVSEYSAPFLIKRADSRGLSDLK